MKRYWQLLLGALISALFIYWALPSLHLGEVQQALGTANYWWILPGILVYFIGLWVRSWRGHYTLRHFKPIPPARLYPLICIGYFGNNIYPFRAGEVIRSYVLKRKEDIAMSSSLATVLIERVFDGLVMLLFVFVALPFAPALPTTYRNAVVLFTILLLAATILFIWMATQPKRMTTAYRWFTMHLLSQGIRQRTDKIYERFIAGLQSLSRGSDVLMIFATSVLIWLMETVKYWFVMHAFHFEVRFLVLMLMNGLVNLATTLPSAPGYIGTFDTPGIATLVAFGVEPNLAASYTFTLHAALWLPVTLVGAYYFWRAQLHWSDFSNAQQQAKSNVTREGI